MKISVIVPVYNEEKTIKEILEKINTTGLANEIIIVDDGSTDKTKEILDRLSYNNVKVLHHEKNQGKGAAVRTALQHVTGDVLIIQDADLEYDPYDYLELIKPIKSGYADVVYGSRLLGGKPQRTHLFWHKLGNSFLSLLTDFI